MQRYFVPPDRFRDGIVQIQGEDARHIVRVMRMGPGDRIIAVDGQGRAVRAVIRDATPDEVVAEAEETLSLDSEPRWDVTIAQSLPKGDKMELIIQKGTEIGACAFAPFQSERMIVQYDAKKEAKRLERWGKIAKEAAEQSHRGRIPELHAVRSWRELLGVIGDYDLALFCYEREGDAAHGVGLATAVREWLAGRAAEGAASGTPSGRPPRLLVIAGPEGGFAEREAEEAAAAGAVKVGLGRRILRAETAAIVALSCLMYESGEMGGA